jgi:hypothetical protein
MARSAWEANREATGSALREGVPGQASQKGIQVVARLLQFKHVFKSRAQVPTFERRFRLAPYLPKVLAACCRSVGGEP